jgi:hypothetical protein
MPAPGCPGGGLLEGRVSAVMNAARLADVIKELIETYVDCGAEALGEPGLDRASVDAFAEAGVVTNDEGVVVTLEDGSEFHVTVVQSKGAR